MVWELALTGFAGVLWSPSHAVAPAPMGTRLILLLFKGMGTSVAEILGGGGVLVGGGQLLVGFVDHGLKLSPGLLCRGFGFKVSVHYLVH